MAIKTILFDLDGTLVDTEPTAWKVMLDRFYSWGISLDAEDEAFVTGRTWGAGFDHLFSKYVQPLSSAHIERCQAEAQIMNAYRESLRLELTPVPGAVDAVRLLARDYGLGVVSGSGRAEILWILNRLGIAEAFGGIFGAEDYERSKPAPDGYRAAIAHFQTAGHEALAFEDSSAGVQSASAAGLHVVAVGNRILDGMAAKVRHRIADFRVVHTDWIRRLPLESLQ